MERTASEERSHFIGTRRRQVGQWDDWRCGFTVLELLVSVAILGLLIALVLPAIMVARETARRTVCRSHLRELGVAMQNHHASHQRLPRAWRATEQDSDFAYGWAAQLLPEIEQQEIRQSLDFHRRPNRFVTSEDSVAASLPLLLCPSDITESSFELHEEVDDDEEADSASSQERSTVQAPALPGWLLALPTASYVGVFGTAEADDFDEFLTARTSDFADGSVIHDRRVRFADLRRGLSNTLLVGERTMALVPSTWLGVDLRGEDAACRLVGSAMTRPNCSECDECEFTSRHAGGSNFFWADGHVSLVDDSVETQTYRQFAMRDSE